MEMNVPIVVNMPARAVVRALLDECQKLVDTLPEGVASAAAAPRQAPPSMRLDALPALGERYQDGLYAGLTLHEGLPHALVLLEGEAEEVSWERAKGWADEHAGVLPSRIDALVLWQNLRDRFDKDDWYWTSEQDASDSSCAWVQYFSGGGQNYYHTSNKYRARAVRRVPIR